MGIICGTQRSDGVYEIQLLTTHGLTLSRLTALLLWVDDAKYSAQSVHIALWKLPSGTAPDSKGKPTTDYMIIGPIVFLNLLIDTPLSRFIP